MKVFNYMFCSAFTVVTTRLAYKSRDSHTEQSHLPSEVHQSLSRHLNAAVQNIAVRAVGWVSVKPFDVRHQLRHNIYLGFTRRGAR